MYLNGYHVRTGQASNSAYAIRDGLFTLHVGDQGGEVWIDSPPAAGNHSWVAVVDGATNYTMVERFHFERGAEYPGKATVIFYTTGLPRPPRTPPPADAPPPQPIYYIEAEINSPMIDLAPGERYTMRTEWFPTRMGRAFKTATYAGVVGQPLTVTAPAPNPTAPNPHRPTTPNPTGQNAPAPPASATRTRHSEPRARGRVRRLLRRPPRRALLRSRRARARRRATCRSEPAAARRAPDHRVRARGDDARVRTSRRSERPRSRSARRGHRRTSANCREIIHLRMTKRRVRIANEDNAT